MNAGSIIGYKIASMDNKFFVIAIGFILGLCTILAEPAVYALTHQIEEVTRGYVKRKSVLFTMSIGVGIAIALSVVRILIPKLQLWQYLLPGYAIALILTYIVPKLFVGRYHSTFKRNFQQRNLGLFRTFGYKKRNRIYCI